MSRPPIAFPAFLDLRKRLVVVIGEGAMAERKARGLLKYGADVVVIGANPTMPLVEAEADGLLTLERRPYAHGDLAGAFVVICLDSEEGVRRAVLAEADERGCLVSVPEEPDSSNFSTPSIVRRGSLQIAISTAGLAPEVARQVKTTLAEEFGEEWAEYVALMGQLRESLASSSPEERRLVLNGVIASDVLERLRQGQALDAAALLEEFGLVQVDAADVASDATEASAAGDAGAETGEAPKGVDY